MSNIVIKPIVTVALDCDGNEKLIVHSHINLKGKMVLNKDEAALLLLELHKFVTTKKNEQ